MDTPVAGDTIKLIPNVYVYVYYKSSGLPCARLGPSRNGNTACARSCLGANNRFHLLIMTSLSQGQITTSLFYLAFLICPSYSLLPQYLTPVPSMLLCPPPHVLSVVSPFSPPLFLFVPLSMVSINFVPFFGRFDSSRGKGDTSAVREHVFAFS